MFNTNDSLDWVIGVGRMSKGGGGSIDNLCEMLDREFNSSSIKLWLTVNDSGNVLGSDSNKSFIPLVVVGSDFVLLSGFTLFCE